MGPLGAYIPRIEQAARANPNAYAERTIALPRQALADAQRMAGLLDRLAHHPSFQERLLAGMPEGARHRQGDIGSIFSCLDYHHTANGLRLIEGNTHASGGVASALWQALLQQHGKVVQPLFADVPNVLDHFWHALEADWAAFTARADRPLRTIAIVDDDPPHQPYYNEFLLAQSLLSERGYQVHVLDAHDLRDLIGADLVYNRCCDFYLEDPAHHRLREALVCNEAVFTPSPHMHAIIGRKDLLVYLDQMADGAGPDAPLSTDERRFLRRIVPTAHFLTDVDRENIWRDRKQWVFKPLDRYQAKGVFRGKSLSRTTFDTLPSDGYIIQEYIPPSIPEEGLKAEIRFYHHGNAVQFGVARLYEGQVTNFRKPRGGNAPLVFADEASADIYPPCG